MMATVKSYFRKYLPFAASSIQRYMSYRANFFIFFIGGFLRAFITYYIWQAVFAASGNPEGLLGGFSLKDMSVYVFLAVMVQEVTHSEADHTISDEVVTGKISVNLVRPISYHGRLLWESIGGVSYHFLFLGIPIWATLHLVVGMVHGIGIPSLAVFAPFLLSIILSFLLIFFLNMSFGFLAFHTTKIWGLRNVKFILIDFFSGAIIPLSFFPVWAQEITNWLPFRSMLYDPMLIYLGKLQGTEILSSLGLQALWVLVFFTLSHLVWRSSIRRLTIFGG